MADSWDDPPRLVVVKVGGSLLATPDGVATVERWLARTRAPHTCRLLIAGGGPTVDGLRKIDAANPAPVAATHWAAVQLMDVHTRLLASWIVGVGAEKMSSGFQRQPGRDAALLVEDWLRDHEPHASGEPLTIGWQTTSDAIAARLAVVLGGGLALLKLALPAGCDSLADAAAAGAVDAETPRVGASLDFVRVVALSPQTAERPRGPLASNFLGFSTGEA